MNFDIAKSALAKGYVDAGLELVEEAALELQFKFRDIQLTIPESEIQDYAEFIASRELFEPVPADCSICSTNYREHLVHSIDRSRILSSVRLGREKEILLGTQDDNNAYVTLGSASQTFINYFRFDEQYVKACKSQLSRRFVLGERSPMLMKRFEYRPTTIRVHNIMASNIPSALKLSSIMIDSSLFGLQRGSRCG